MACASSEVPVLGCCGGLPPGNRTIGVSWVQWGYSHKFDNTILFRRFRVLHQLHGSGEFDLSEFQYVGDDQSGINQSTSLAPTGGLVRLDASDGYDAAPKNPGGGLTPSYDVTITDTQWRVTLWLLLLGERQDFSTFTYDFIDPIPFSFDLAQTILDGIPFSTVPPNTSHLYGPDSVLINTNATLSTGRASIQVPPRASEARFASEPLSTLVGDFFVFRHHHAYTLTKSLGFFNAVGCLERTLSQGLFHPSLGPAPVSYTCDSPLGTPLANATNGILVLPDLAPITMPVGAPHLFPIVNRSQTQGVLWPQDPGGMFFSACCDAAP